MTILEANERSSSEDNQGKALVDKEKQLVENIVAGIRDRVLEGERLECLGPRLYQWKDGGEYGRWLEEHPDSSRDELVESNFL